MSKKGFSKKMYFVLVFLCWRKQKRKSENMEKDNFKKAQKIMFFGWSLRKKAFIVKWHSLKNRQTLFVFGRQIKKKGAFSLQLSVLGRWSFVCSFKVTKHYTNRGFSRHRGKPKIALSVAKVPFWEGASKGALLSVIPKSCALLKTLFYSVFSKTQLCTYERV